MQGAKAKPAVRRIRAGKPRRLGRSRLGNAVVMLFLFALGLFIAIPFLFAILQSIKPIEEIFVFPPRFYVVNPTLENFASVARLTGNTLLPLSRFIFNSVFVTALVTVVHVIIASMAAFPLAKFKFPGSKALYNIIVLALLFTYEVTWLPMYIIMSNLHIINTYWAIILPALATPLGLFLMRQFMQVIPDAMLEAASIDGASNFVSFWRIAMPQSKPAWMTLVIFSFQGIWAREGTEYIYNSELKMLPTVLRQIASGGVARAGAAAAVAVLLMLPPMLIFIFSQSQVIETMAYSGIKE